MKSHYDFSKFLVVPLMALAGTLGYVPQAYATFTAAPNALTGISVVENAKSSSTSLMINHRITEAEPYIELDNRTFNKARGKVGQKVEVGKVHVKAVDMPGEVTIVPSGAVEGIYTTDVKTIPAGTSEVDITIFYEAKKIGKNEGKLFFMVGEDIYEQINLKGLAIDPATPPAVVLEPTSFKEFKTEVGTPVSDTIVAKLVGLPSSVNVSVKQDAPGFTCNTGLLYYSVPSHKLVVTFNPKSAGTYEATVTLSNEFFEPVVLTVKGTATAKEDVKPDVEGDQLPLPTDNPVKLLNEGFDTGVHNKPLSLKGWTNLAALGARAWWGYTFPEYDTENAGEFVAKVTPYDSKVDYGQETDCQMLLVTPPLDYKNAASKMFTFRVMGKNMTEGMLDELMFCNLIIEEGGLYVMPVEGVEMPSRPDQNGEWIDYHVDLSGMELDNVFYMAFFFRGQRGTVSSASYFIYDVSYGRTDLPLMTPDKPEVSLKVEPNAAAQSEAVKVEAKNLTQPIKLTLGGRDKASFEVSAKELSVNGGSFFVKFKGEAEGSYEAYVKLSSRGAATKYVAFFVSAVTGVQSVVVEQGETIEVLDINGRKLRQLTGAKVSNALQSLPHGTYILKVNGALGSRSVKVMK